MVIIQMKKMKEHITNDKYLKEEDLKQLHTYKDVNMLNWGTYYDYDVLRQNKYPILSYNNAILEGQDGIEIPEDPILEEEQNLNYEFIGDSRPRYL